MMMTKMVRLLGAAGLLAASMGAMPATAQQVTATNPDSVAKVLRDRGFRAELTKDSQGDPLIKSGAEGVSFLLLFFNCNGGKNCATVQLYAGFDRNGEYSLEKLNDWNRENRFGRAYRDKDGDPVIEMDIDLDDGGMSTALFEDNLEFWTTIVSKFKNFIDS